MPKRNGKPASQNRAKKRKRALRSPVNPFKVLAAQLALERALAKLPDQTGQAVKPLVGILLGAFAPPRGITVESHDGKPLALTQDEVRTLGQVEISRYLSTFLLENGS